MRAGTKLWLEIAESDYDVSLHLFKRANHPQALYLVCQAVEKILKAAQVEFVNQTPKKTHQLETIAQETGLSFSPEQYVFLEDLSKHYRRVRYPDIYQVDYNTKAKVEPLINQAKELYLWTLAKFNHN